MGGPPGARRPPSPLSPNRGFAFGWAHFGNLPFVLAQLLLAPAAVVCWVQASVGSGGDRWTAGYVALWVLEIVVLRIGAWII